MDPPQSTTKEAYINMTSDPATMTIEEIQEVLEALSKGIIKAGEDAQAFKTAGDLNGFKQEFTKLRDFHTRRLALLQEMLKKILAHTEEARDLEQMMRRAEHNPVAKEQLQWLIPTLESRKGVEENMRRMIEEEENSLQECNNMLNLR